VIPIYLTIQPDRVWPTRCPALVIAYTTLALTVRALAAARGSSRRCPMKSRKLPASMAASRMAVFFEIVLPQMIPGPDRRTHLFTIHHRFQRVPVLVRVHQHRGATHACRPV